MSEAAVEVESIRKRYGRFEALREVALVVPRGEVFGLLGPNGAGKSTLVKILLTIVRPAECRGRLLGAKIGDRRTLARVGYLPEQARFPGYLTGRQIVEYSAGLARVSRRRARARATELLERVGMAGRADQESGAYSKGMRQRVGLAQALVNDPELVFLDEPTDGVDPEGRVEIRNIISDMRAEGRTVFVNSHLLAEMEEMADAVAIMVRGRVVEQGKMGDLTHRGSQFRVRTAGPVPFDLRERLEAEGWKVGGDTILCQCTEAAEVQGVLDLLRGARVVVRELSETRSTLEEVFLRAVHGEKGRGT